MESVYRGAKIKIDGVFGEALSSSLVVYKKFRFPLPSPFPRLFHTLFFPSTSLFWLNVKSNRCWCLSTQLVVSIHKNSFTKFSTTIMITNMSAFNNTRFECGGLFSGEKSQQFIKVSVNCWLDKLLQPNWQLTHSWSLLWSYIFEKEFRWNDITKKHYTNHCNVSYDFTKGFILTTD